MIGAAEWRAVGTHRVTKPIMVKRSAHAKLSLVSYNRLDFPLVQTVILLLLVKEASWLLAERSITFTFATLTNLSPRRTWKL